MRQGLTYSNLVAWLKVLLPLTALGILSTVFLVSHEVDLEAAIPFAKPELEKRLRDRQITAPYYTGQTKQGHDVTITSVTAHPDPDDTSRILAESVGALVLTRRGTEITVTANAGDMDGGFEEIILEGNVEVLTSSGYTLLTEEMTVALEEIRADTAGEVTVFSALGELKAGRMAIRPAGENDDVYLFFTKGVQLVYTPPKAKR